MRHAKTFGKIVAVVVTSSIMLVYSCSKNTPASTLATVSTTSATAISNTSAIAGGSVTADAGHTVIARGLCWSTSHGPTIAGSLTTAATAGLGTYTVSLTGLTASKTYYVRAFATNSGGTAYGNEVTITTAAVADNTALLTVRPWVYSVDTYTPTGGATADQLALKPCLKDDTLTYTSTMQLIITDGGLQCSPPGSSTTGWAFASGETQLVLGNGTTTYTITTLDLTMLSITRTSVNGTSVFQFRH